MRLQFTVVPKEKNMIINNIIEFDLEISIPNKCRRSHSQTRKLILGLVPTWFCFTMSRAIIPLINLCKAVCSTFREGIFLFSSLKIIVLII